MTRIRPVYLKIAFILAVPVWGVLGVFAGSRLDAFPTLYVLAYYHLAVGWAAFLSRVVHRITPDWFSVGLALGCLLVLVGMLHWSCAWLSREVASRRSAGQADAGPLHTPVPRWRLRTTLSIVGIVVLLFVAGTAAVGSIHQLVWMRTRS